MALRAVAEDETAPPKTVTEAASKGSQCDLLVAMRDRIAKTVEDPKCPPRDLASLSRRLMEITKDIEAIEAREEQDGDAGEPTEDGTFDPKAV